MNYKLVPHNQLEFGKYYWCRFRGSTPWRISMLSHKEPNGTLHIVSPPSAVMFDVRDTDEFVVAILIDPDGKEYK